ncbi:MAG: magnesium/cobalt transporter CorA [Bacteroidia bacterium]|nr:magnesium/cobalt transporter CorA [Bacteroidia bacterium]
MIRLITYTEQTASAQEPARWEDAAPLLQAPGIHWLDLYTDVQTQDAEHAALYLQLHHMVFQDICEIRHLPRFECFDSYLFLMMKMLRIKPDTLEVQVEQVSMILGPDYVATFQESILGDVFDPVRKRILENIGRIRRMPSDYLFYRLIDAIVEAYREIVELLRERIEDLEEEMYRKPRQERMQEITFYKKQISRIRKYLTPLPEEISKLRSDPNKLIHSATHTYFRDVYDQLLLLNANLDSMHNSLKDLVDLHLSSLSHSMNRVMKTLTVVTTIFIPLTFIAGIYGMNFTHMPELHWAWGYPAVLALMGGIAAGMVWYMRKKHWF